VARENKFAVRGPRITSQRSSASSGTGESRSLGNGSSSTTPIFSIITNHRINLATDTSRARSCVPELAGIGRKRRKTRQPPILKLPPARAGMTGIIRRKRTYGVASRDARGWPDTAANRKPASLTPTWTDRRSSDAGMIGRTAADDVSLRASSPRPASFVRMSRAASS